MNHCRGSHGACALVLAAVIAGSSAPTRASDTGVAVIAPDPISPATALGISSGIFGVIDVGYALAWRPLPPLLSGIEVDVAGLLVPGIVLDDELQSHRDGALLSIHAAL